MAKILKMPDLTERAAATTAPQDVLAEDAATFDVLRRMREDILCCVLKPDQRLRFGELRQRYDTSVGTLREALSHLVSEGLARTEAGRGFSVAPISLADFLDLSELRVYLETRTLADATSATKPIGPLAGARSFTALSDRSTCCAKSGDA